MTYFRACGHYHRPRELNGRVRNGNVCFLTRKVTGKDMERGSIAPCFVRTEVRTVSTGGNSRVTLDLGDSAGSCEPPRFLGFRSTSRKAREQNDEAEIKVVKLSSVSTGPLRRLHALHFRPITWWSTRGLQVLRPTKPDLGKGFALICFQRLSRPYIATLRCLERDNRNTRGTSLQILSY
jgi:hypothetical protein